MVEAIHIGMPGLPHCPSHLHGPQAVGPVAMICLLLSSGMTDYIPGQYDNADPNRPSNPDAQHAYNTAAIQVPVHNDELASAAIGHILSA